MLQTEESAGYAGRIEAYYGQHLLPFMVLMRTKDTTGYGTAFEERARASTLDS